MSQGVPRNDQPQRTTTPPTFTVVRRGFDQSQVLSYFASLNESIRAISLERDRMSGRINQLEEELANPSLDIDKVTDLFGRQASEILRSAHDAATSIRQRAENSAREIVARAHREASELEARSQLAAEGQLQEAQETAKEVIEGARSQSQEILVMAERGAQSIVERAKSEGRAMIHRARESRAKVFEETQLKITALESEIERLETARNVLIQLIRSADALIGEAGSLLDSADAKHQDQSANDPGATDDEEGLVEGSVGSDTPQSHELEGAPETTAEFSGEVLVVDGDVSAQLTVEDEEVHRDLDVLFVKDELRSHEPAGATSTPSDQRGAAEGALAPQTISEESSLLSGVEGGQTEGDETVSPSQVFARALIHHREQRSSNEDGAMVTVETEEEAHDASISPSEVFDDAPRIHTEISPELGASDLHQEVEVDPLGGTPQDDVNPEFPFGEYRSDGEGAQRTVGSPHIKDPLKAEPWSGTTGESNPSHRSEVAAEIGVAMAEERGRSASERPEMDPTQDDPEMDLEGATAAIRGDYQVRLHRLEDLFGRLRSQPSEDTGAIEHLGAEERSGNEIDLRAERDGESDMVPAAGVQVPVRVEGAEVTSEGVVVTDPGTVLAALSSALGVAVKETSPALIDTDVAREMSIDEDGLEHLQPPIGGEVHTGESLNLEPPVAPQRGTNHLLRRRSELVGATEVALSRRLKRILQDDQSLILDELRKNGVQGACRGAESLGSEPDRNVGTIVTHLRDAASLGLSFAESFVEVDAPDQRYLELSSNLDAKMIALAEDLSRTLDALSIGRVAAMEAALEECDESSQIALIGSVFRDIRATKVEELVGDFINGGFTSGIRAYRGAKGHIWITNDLGGNCSDCDDNALAGVNPPEEDFPTGHRTPPVHGGCRCLIVPVFA